MSAILESNKLKCEIPILLLGFNRPHLMRRVFDKIASVRPTQLFVAVDGPRPHVATDKSRCEEVRRVTELVDWPCQLEIRFNPENLGCKRAIESAIGWFFDKVEGGIILEDDCLPNDSFFPFCTELLERYASNEQVMCISGDNFLPQSLLDCLAERSSYYFTKYMHCWGWATWRRAWRHYCPNLTNPSGRFDADVIGQFPTSAAEARYWSKRFHAVRSGRINTWDYGWQHAIWKNRGLVVAPSVNLVKNIGFGEDATHTTGNTNNASPVACDLIVASHPDTVRQDLIADQREAELYYRFGEKTLLDRALAEVQRAWCRQFYSNRAA